MIACVGGLFHIYMQRCILLVGLQKEKYRMAHEMSYHCLCT